MNVEGVINTLCDKFGTTAERLLPEIIRYVQAYEIAYMVVCLISVVVLAFAIRFCVVRFLKMDEYKDGLYFPVAGCIILLVVALFIAGVLLITEIPDLVTAFVSPTASAINFILGKCR